MNLNSGKKLSKSASGLRIIPVSDVYASPFALPEPMWIADNEVVSCASCQKSFDFFKRKHHCRRCGKCFCDRCCHFVIPLRRMYFVDPVRHCYDCAVISKAEVDFFDNSLKVLVTGANFSVFNSLSEIDEGKFKCSFSDDSRIIKFHPLIRQNLTSSLPKLLLVKMKEAEFTTNSNQGSSASQSPLAVQIEYKDNEDAAIVHKLKLNPLDPRESTPWLVAFQKKLKKDDESVLKQHEVAKEQTTISCPLGDRVVSPYESLFLLGIKLLVGFFYFYKLDYLLNCLG